MKLLSILGPTASGKSSVALAVANQLNGEIISCDSMQIYRELTIGTAKVTPAEQVAIPHHLLNIRDISERFSVADFICEADAAILECIQRQKQPILCGGTGLYAKALLYGFDFRPRDKEIAESLRRDLDERGPKALLAELRELSPEAAAKAGDNPRHCLRALEVLRITGKAPQEQEQFKEPPYVAPEFILMPSPELSRERIRRRAASMLDAGWIDETKAIGAERFRHSATAQQAIGYSLILDYLENTLSYNDLLEKIVTGTARYAKRQRTWFRHQHPKAIIIPVVHDDTAETLAQQILERFSP